MKISLTVVICHYEQHADLRRCVESILCQTDKPEKVLIIDDASEAPPSVSALPNHQDVIVEVYAGQKNFGSPAKPRNIGVNLCTTTHLAFLDADDQWLPDTARNMKKIWEKWPNVIAHGDIIAWKEEGSGVYLQQALSTSRAGKSEKNTYQRLLSDGNQVFLSTTGGPTAVFKANPTDPEQVWEDYDLWLRLAQQEVQFVHTGSIHTLYQVKRASRSRSRQYRHAGCKGMKEKHLRHLPPWEWPLWYWKQRWL